jgi:hypothetical protein
MKSKSVALLFVCVAFASLHGLSQDTDSKRQNVCNRIKQVRAIPFEELKDPNKDSAYAALIADGASILPSLVECITDERKMPDPRPVPTVSDFRVGDLAFMVAAKSSDVKFEDTLPPEVMARWNDDGVYGYFAYVARKGARRALQKCWQEWLKTNYDFQQHRIKSVVKTLPHPCSQVVGQQ